VRTLFFYSFFIGLLGRSEIDCLSFAASPYTRVRFPLADFWFGLKVSQAGETSLRSIQQTIKLACEFELK
jgi:hypothetical protein